MASFEASTAPDVPSAAKLRIIPMTVPSRPTIVLIDAMVDSAMRLRSSSGVSRPEASWIAAWVSATILSFGAPSFLRSE